MTSRASTVTWLFVHIVFPLAPFALAGAARLIVTRSLSWDTFSASELAISLALLTLLLHQCLLRSERRLDSEEKREEVAAWAYVLAGVSVFFIVLFVLNVVFDTQVNKLLEEQHEPSLRISEAVVFLLFPFAVYLAVLVQRTFHLKAAIA